MFQGVALTSFVIVFGTLQLMHGHDSSSIASKDSEGNPVLCQESQERLPDFPRIQPVHEWIEEWRHEEYQHAHDLLQVGGNVGEPVGQNGERSHNLEGDQDDELRHAGVDGLHLGVGPLRDHAGDQYLHVGEGLDGDAQQLQEGRDQQPHHVVDGGVSAPELEQRRAVAEHVEDDRLALGQPRVQGEHQQDEGKVQAPDEGDDAQHGPRGHDGVVAQRHADGGVAVEGHGGQDEEDPAAVHVQQEALQDAQRVLDRVRLGHDVRQHLGQHGGDADQVVEREAQEDEVHGPVQVPPHHDEGQQGGVAEGGEEVDDHAESEQEVLAPGGDDERVQDELRARGERRVLHVPCDLWEERQPCSSSGREQAGKDGVQRGAEASGKPLDRPAIFIVALPSAVGAAVTSPASLWDWQWLKTVKNTKLQNKNIFFFERI